MIYVTGDTHGEFERFSRKNFPEGKELTKEDYVIICGDFGGVWEQEKDKKKEDKRLDLLEELPFTLLFLDGNHGATHCKLKRLAIPPSGKRTNFLNNQMIG